MSCVKENSKNVCSKRLIKREEKCLSLNGECDTYPLPYYRRVFMRSNGLSNLDWEIMEAKLDSKTQS